MTAERPGVSFVVPVYNKARYLPGVLAALRAQAGDFEREYIFVDDGSTDDSLAVLRETTARWDDVTIHAQANHGSAHATNRGVDRARSAYVKYVDADDLLTADATRTLLTALRDTDACLAYGERIAYADEAEIDLAARVEGPAATRLDRPLLAALRNSLFNPTQVLARTECVRAVGGCDERIVHSQEYSLGLRLAHRWPFLAVAAPVTFRPAAVPGSLGTNPAAQLWRVSMACAHFLADHPELPAAVKRFACRRVAGRAWKFARRERGAGLGSPWFRYNLRSLLPPGADAAGFIARCAGAFDLPEGEDG